MSVKAVIFDLDGTITTFNLDFKTLRADARGYLLNKGMPASVLKVNESVFEMLKKAEMYMKNQGKPGNSIETIRREILAIAEKFELEAAMSASLLPGVIEAVKTLRRKNLKIGLCTINSEKSVAYILKRFNIAEFFDAVVPRQKVTFVKPHPEHFRAVLNALGATAAETVVVGDSTTDMEGAKELKAIAVGLPTGVSTTKQLINHGANYIITSITDLPVLIEQINKT